MRHILFLSLLSVTSFSWAAADWKVVAETTVCADKIQIMGKDGEKYVLAVNGNEKTKLFAKDGSAFNEDSMQTTEFTAANANGDTSYRFIHPSYVEANPPKIDVSYNGQKKRCKMELNR